MGGCLWASASRRAKPSIFRSNVPKSALPATAAAFPHALVVMAICVQVTRSVFLVKPAVRNQRGLKQEQYASDCDRVEAMRTQDDAGAWGLCAACTIEIHHRVDR